VSLTNEQKILELGLSCNLQKPVQHFIQNLVINTENVISLTHSLTHLLTP